MKNTLSRMQYDEKKAIDKVFIDELVSENRKKLETEEYARILADILSIDDEKFISSFRKFWDFHNHFNNDYIDLILSKDTELSPSDLQLILDTLRFANQVDFEWLALSWVLKQKAEYLISKLKDIYNRDSINQEPNKWSFFVRYKRHHLLYLYALKTWNPHIKLIKDSILNQYHSWDEDLFNIRLERDFNEFLNYSAEELNNQIEELTHHSHNIEWKDEKNLNDILTFDNLVEYQYISQLQWLPALKLQHKVKDILESENLNSEDLNEWLSKLIEKKQLKNKYHVNWYRQTWLTCSAASLLMALNYFYWTKFSKDLEDEIARKSSSDFIPWQHYSWIWLYAVNKGLKTKLIHSDTNFFQNPWFSNWMFEYLMSEYENYYKDFCEKWWLSDFNSISNDDIINELKNWYLVLLAWEYDDILHTKLIIWYDIPNRTFNVIDPLVWKESNESFDDIQRFCSTSLWKWMLAVQKAIWEDWDNSDKEWKVHLNQLEQEFWKFKESIHEKDNVIDINDIMFYDYKKHGTKWYNLSIVKNYWLNVLPWIVLSPECIEKIENESYDDLEKEKLEDEIESTMWDGPYIVRSNFVWEDSLDKSYAWYFESYLNIDKNNLYDTIRKVLKSWRWSKSNNLHWWVLIQKMVYWDASWVAFITKNGINIDITNWMNEKLVSWEISPDRIKIKEDGSIESNTSLLGEKQLKELADSLKKVREIFNKWMDVEFSIKDWKVFILQARPITTDIQYSVNDLNVWSNMWEFNVVVVSNWEFSGKIKIIENNNDIWDIDEDCIVITKQLYPDLIKKIHKVKWIISEKWWQLAHLSIVWREMWIPILSWCEWIVWKCKESNISNVLYTNKFISFS